MSLNLLAELQARAAQVAANQPLWLQPDHDQTVIMSVANQHFNDPVSAIIIHSSKVGLGSDTVKAAHFRIFLQLSSITSLELDSYGLQQTKTKLKITYRKYLYSTTQATMNTLRVPVKASFTVSDVVTTLLTKNRDRYYLDSKTGSGCRYWCKVVIADFIEKGWVDGEWTNCVEELTNSIKASGRFQDVDIPVPAPQGTFY